METYHYTSDDAVMQLDVQHTDASDPQSPQSEDADVEERSEGADVEEKSELAVCTASFAPKASACKSKALSTRAIRPISVESYREVDYSIEPMTPQRTPSRVSLINLALPMSKDTSNSNYLYLLDQGIDDFFPDSYRDIQRFDMPENDLGTYKAILDSLTNQASQAEHMGRKGEELGSGILFKNAW
ncbi:hypothetical protein F66182_9174 [Fusarium sp. NRRL 66182]|nr:hypothetical protein F66182_9174 [Fusarium sp. NRRL 66182]